MAKTIYLDNSATTPVYQEVIKAMNNVELNNYGNPNSQHELGEKALKLINESRKNLAIEIGAKAHEIIFTSGGTESNNLALFGIVNANKDKKKENIIISTIEHSSIFEPTIELKKHGYEIKKIEVNREGLADINKLEKEINDKTLIVSIIHGNNEIGVLQDLRKIGGICKRKKVLFHTDAVQSFGKERINVREFGIDLLSASAHKIGGPKGIGLLFVREGVKIEPLLYGGGQEAGRRAGTENVPAIVGFAKALNIINKIDKEPVRKLRDYLISKLEEIGSKINGSRERRLWNHVSASLPGENAEMLVIKLSQKGIFASTKSACLSKQNMESRVLKAIGLNKDEIKGNLRIVLNESIKKKDIDFVVHTITNALNYQSISSVCYNK